MIGALFGAGAPKSGVGPRWIHSSGCGGESPEDRDEVFALRGKSDAAAARIPEAKKLERVKAILADVK